MNDDLRQRLAHDLKHSGFYSEMLAIRTCIARKWECHGSFTYFDKDEQTSRECDFEAVRRVTLAGAEGAVEVVARLLGQVKKSEKPWIVFKDEHPRGSDDAEESSDIIHSGNVGLEPAVLTETLRKGSLLSEKGWRGSGVHEAFKKPGDTSAWYGAFVTACKAAESALEGVTAISVPHRAISLHFLKPVVVLDGVLVAAQLDRDGELLLTEIDSAPFVFEYQSEAYRRSRYHLDLVTLEGLPAYLDLIVNQIGRVVAELK